MENKIEARKKFIYEKVGEEAIAVTNILREQEEQREKLGAQAEFGTVEDIMTSELVYKSKSAEDVFGKEYSRRLHLIGLDDNQIRSLHQVESLILSTGSMSEERKQPWVRRYFIMPDSTPEKMPKIDEMTLSELLLITDDANSAFYRDHHVLSGEAWQALCIAACYTQYTEARYAYGFNARTEKLGWSKAQSGAYTRNECLLTERLKWGHHENPAWTPRTTNLEQFKR